MRRLLTSSLQASPPGLLCLVSALLSALDLGSIVPWEADFGLAALFFGVEFCIVELDDEAGRRKGMGTISL